MTIQEKIEQNELQIKNHLSELRNTLNTLSKINKEKPNDWAYLTALSLSQKSLHQLNTELAEVSKNIK